MKNWLTPQSLSACLIALAPLTMTTAASAQAPHPDEVEIKDVTVNGSGCPIGTATVLLTNSKPNGPADYFQVTYDNFIVERGDDLAPKDSRKFCNLALDVKFPQGWAFTIFKMEMDGYAEIAKGARGEVKTEYFFPHVSRKKRHRKKVRGPFEGDYNQMDEIGVFSSITSRCGVTIPLNLKTTMRLSGSRKKYSTMTVDVQSGLFVQKFGIRWKRCSKHDQPFLKSL